MENKRLVLIDGNIATVFEVRKLVAQYIVENINELSKDDIEAIRIAEYLECPVLKPVGGDLLEQLSTLPWGTAGGLLPGLE